MYCTQCGQQLKNTDNFCFNCGLPNTRGILHDSVLGTGKNSPERGTKRYTRQNGSSDVPLDLKIKLGLGFVVLVLIAPIALLFIRLPKSLEENAIRLETLPSAKQEIKMEGCQGKDEECKIVIDGKPFPLEKRYEETGSLRRHLINLAKNYDGKKATTLTLFDETKRNRYFDVSFDISGSVVELDSADVARGAEIKYSDVIFEKVKQYLERRLAPGDIIKVRLYGPVQRDNPCKEIFTFHYEKPEWEAEFLYSDRNKIAVIKIGEPLRPTTTRNASEITANSLNVIFENMHRLYSEALANENRWCHIDTFIDQHLSRILDDVEKGYSSYGYILTNDGEFSFGNSYITDREYASLEQYASADQSFLTENALCSSEEDTFAIIGIDYKGNLSYRQAVEDFFNKILAPCQVIFKNF